ncbi:GTPase-associated system all-helical protein GASH [Methylomonas sp. OY6]|uniref:GTPase-associated system all-helical protein GASH n=1 Tax=Methylomonas defluvii TaxID=3045149 RepID=A0ABU4UDE9_9GAMM|nr:GTPase-associated system all-helical protein GASH [Methylomonas sp. OY6]MDX8126749.1 GTPase-associated system all-helical protein GASH [Methylomonas sp. OY6]
MTESILQSYLNEQHIKTHVQEDIDSLNKAVNEVKKYLTRRKIKSDIIPYTLVALDPKVKDIDPVVQQVETIIIKKWPTFKNSVTATQDKSTTYIRAVILESLSQLSKDDAATTALVWLTARDVIGHYQLDSEENVISGFLQELADRTEENGRAAWGISHKFQANKFKGAEISISAVNAAQINGEALKVHLLDAMVHSGWSSQAGGGKNPSHQGVQSHQWPQFMAEHSAMGITKVVNSALSQQAKSISSISTSIQDSLDTYFAQLQPFFEDLNTSFANSITANNKRSELLWWKESMYSRLLNASYRSLNPMNAAVCMALDLAEEVGAISPESVDYLLRETLKDVYGEQAEEERLIADWLMDRGSLHGGIQSALKEHAAGGDERKPFLNAWANVVQSGDPTDFFSETGIDKTAKLTASDLAVWLFHGLQAQKLAIDN